MLSQALNPAPKAGSRVERLCAERTTLLHSDSQKIMPELFFRRGFMRTCVYCTLIFISAAAFGQDTNFATGPQYLITTGAPMLARAISTPG